MENHEEKRKKKTKFSPKSTSLFKNEQIKIKSSSQSSRGMDQIRTDVEDAIQNRDEKSLRNLSTELTRDALKKMRSINRK